MSHYEPIPGTLVIAFCGEARHGKDTAADAILDLGTWRTVQRFAFSDAISSFCRVRGMMTTRDPRTLQDYGMSLREKRSSCWDDALYWLIDERRPPLALITGVRFPNEVEMIHQMGGALIRIKRLQEKNGQLVPYRSNDRDPNHKADVQIRELKADHEIENIGNNVKIFQERVRLYAKYLVGADFKWK